MNNVTVNKNNSQTSHANTLPLAAILCISFVIYAAILIVVLIVRWHLKKENKLSCERCCGHCEKLNCSLCDPKTVFVNPFAICWMRCCEESPCCNYTSGSQCSESCCDKWRCCPITCCQEPLFECPYCDWSGFACDLPDCSVIDCCCVEIRLKNGRNSASDSST